MKNDTISDSEVAILSSYKDRNNYSTSNDAMIKIAHFEREGLFLVYILVPVSRLWPGTH